MQRYKDIVEKLERKVSKLAYIHQVSHTINSIQSVEELLDYALSESLLALESDAGSIFLWDPEKEELELVVSRGKIKKELKGLKKKLGEGVAGFVAKDGKPLLVKDVKDDPKLKDKRGKGRKYRTSSFISVPMFAKGKLKGVISITEKKTEEPFTDDELEFLFIIANHVAVALDNIMLYKKLSNFNMELQEKVTQATNELKEIVHESFMLKTYKENIIESLTTGVFVVNENGIVTLWNTGMENHYGINRTGILGRDIYVFLSELGLSDLGEHIRLAIDKGESSALENIPVNLKGKRAIVNYSIFPLRNRNFSIPMGAVVLHDDVTDKVALEKELRTNERLALIGKIAAGIAHELNNPLDGTRRFINLSIDKIRNSDTADLELANRYLSSAQIGIDRMIKIVRSLLEFSRQVTRGEKKAVDVNGIIRDVVKIIKLQKEFSGVEIKTCLDKNIPLVADNSIQTVFTNLIDNAIDAMPDGGILTIKTGFSPDEKMVEIVVKDTGVGMDRDILDSIFDPFFTTKGDAKGTGLGLAICSEIVKRLKGEIRVDSSPSKGTTFKVCLPVIES